MGHVKNKPDKREVRPWLRQPDVDGEGFSTRVTPKSNFLVITLDVTADPRKTKEKLDESRHTIGEARYRREFQHDRNVSTNMPYFPEYIANGGDDVYVKSIISLADEEVLIGLDFGYRRPALVMGQTNKRRTRLYVMREWMPSNISSTGFRDVCCWLLGEKGKDQIEREGLSHIIELERQAEDGTIAPVPWIDTVGGPPRRVIRYAGHEVLMAKEPTKDSEDATIAGMWAADGYPIKAMTVPVAAREAIMRHVLRTPPPKGLPWLVVDEWCHEIIRAFNGGYTFDKPDGNNEPTKPFKDGWFEHLMDALGYLAVSVIPLTTEVGTEEVDEVASHEAYLVRERKRIARAEREWYGRTKPAPKGSYSRDERESTSVFTGWTGPDTYSRDED